MPIILFVVQNGWYAQPLMLLVLILLVLHTLCPRALSPHTLSPDGLSENLLSIEKFWSKSGPLNK